ncbi:MAG: hypothetical protein PVI86_05995 [Phycisphaerae bacterium]|jgi:type II secretory pathway pseudopilin PulG
MKRHTPKPGYRKPAPLRAFTLAETVCVVVLIGIMATIAVPRFTSMTANSRVSAVCRRITMDLALAQRRARLTGTAHTVKFFTKFEKYTIPGVEDPDHPGLDYVVHLDAEPYGATLSFAEFNCDDEIIFDAYGVPDSGGTVFIRSGDCSKKLAIAAKTGRVTVSDAVPSDIIIPLCMQAQ